MNYLVAGTVAVVVFLWYGGHQGWAVLCVLLGVVAYIIEIRFFDMGPCHGGIIFPCEKGKIWSPFTRTFRFHRACSGSGFRQRLGRRLWDRKVK